MVTKTAEGSVAEVAHNLRALLDTRGVTVFAVIDQAAAAQTAGLSAINALTDALAKP